MRVSTKRMVDIKIAMDHGERRTFIDLLDQAPCDDGHREKLLRFKLRKLLTLGEPDDD